jgi:hypothetical protein
MHIIDISVPFFLPEMEPCAYTIYSKGECTGNNIGSFSGRTHGFCQNQCDALPECRGYYYRKQQCELKIQLCDDPTGKGKMVRKGWYSDEKSMN